MNRIIKFRGKRKDNGEWVYGSLLIGFTGITYIVPAYDHKLGMTEIYEVIPETVGQFTGLLDRNGKEIYEGDVFLTDIAMAVVEWEKEGRFLGFTYMRRIVYVKKEPLVKVIGNIHDNPELLKNN